MKLNLGECKSPLSYVRVKVIACVLKNHKDKIIFDLNFFILTCTHEDLHVQTTSFSGRKRQ